MVWEYGAGTGGFFDENRRGCVVFAEKVAEREERGERERRAERNFGR
tara:strand:+ start:518 stop:658 length:141 start_codon:yes stop_codon:yes gene_type:complete